MRKILFPLLFSLSVQVATAQVKKNEALKDFRFSLNLSVLPSETATGFGGSAYLSYKKLLLGYTSVGGAKEHRTQSGNIFTISDVTTSLNSGSLGYEVSKDLFLKGGYGVYYIGNRVQVINLGISSNTQRFSDWIEMPSFGVLYMNTPNHFNFGFDLVGMSSPLMLFSAGFNL